jgi:hypothetical protein
VRAHLPTCRPAPAATTPHPAQVGSATRARFRLLAGSWAAVSVSASAARQLCRRACFARQAEHNVVSCGDGPGPASGGRRTFRRQRPPTADFGLTRNRAAISPVDESVGPVRWPLAQVGVVGQRQELGERATALASVSSACLPAGQGTRGEVIRTWPGPTASDPAARPASRVCEVGLRRGR